MEVTLRGVQQADIPVLKPWLTAKENAKFLAPFFQNESIRDEQLALFLMRRDKRTFLVLCDGIPVGVMGLTNIDETNRSAEIWSVIGNPNYRRKGVSSTGFVLTLQKAFYDLGLHSVNGWAADGNFTIRIFQKLGFTCIGRQRECHLQDGVYKDRILFDILHNEFKLGPFTTRSRTFNFS
jgi:RimJ/RimL family protein N-acetyltransferase